MSLTAFTWAATAATLLILSLRRPVYAVALYMLTVFAAPQLWWWGDQLPSARYSLWAGVLLLGVVVFQNSRATEEEEEEGHRFSAGLHKVAMVMVLNATFVHLFLAVNRSISIDTYVELLKYVLLTYLICAAVRNKQDLRIVLISIALGSAYLGYEVTINERGDFTASRLEGVGTPSATTANGLACLMLTVLPLIGSLFVDGTKRAKLLVLVAAPLALNVLLLCNSRGAFLGLIGAGLTFFLMARGATRKKAIRTLVLASVALYMLLGDPKILDRFMTTFVGSEERDGAASGRLEFWRAGLAMLEDYPLGAGGGSFKYDLGRRYALLVAGRDEDRSLHNGYLTEATDWGLQGLLLKLLFVGAAMVAAYRTTTRCRVDGRTEDAIVGMSMMAAMVAFLMATVFGSFLNNEWAFWTVALLWRYSELYRVTETSTVAVPASASEVHVGTKGTPILKPALQLTSTSPHAARGTQ